MTYVGSWKFSCCVGLSWPGSLVFNQLAPQWLPVTAAFWRWITTCLQRVSHCRLSRCNNAPSVVFHMIKKMTTPQRIPQLKSEWTLQNQETVTGALGIPGQVLWGGTSGASRRRKRKKTEHSLFQFFPEFWPKNVLFDLDLLWLPTWPRHTFNENVKMLVALYKRSNPPTETGEKGENGRFSLWASGWIAWWHCGTWRSRNLISVFHLWQSLNGIFSVADSRSVKADSPALNEPKPTKRRATWENPIAPVQDFELHVAKSAWEGNLKGA